jgi:zinc protease
MDDDLAGAGDEARCAVIRALAIVAIAGCCPLDAKKTVTPIGGGGGGGGTGSGSGSVVGLVWSDKVEWSKPPAPGPEPAFAPPAPVAFDLPNGAKVLLVENHRLPLISIRVVLPHAGSREDTASKAGLASLAGDMLDEGAGALTSLTFPEELERLGAELDISVGADSATISLDTLVETLPESLKLLGDVLVKPRLAPADFARVQGDRIAELQLRPDSPRRVASLVFEQMLFGASHPYGRPGDGFVASMRRATLADVKVFWRRAYVPAGATIVISGDVDRATIAPQLGTALAGWKGAAPPKRPAPKPPAAIEPKLVFVDRPEAPQSVVVLGRIGPDVTDTRFFAGEVVNTATGGSFASRLNNRLREQLGYTYGIRSTYWRGQWSGSWSILSSLKTANTVDGLKEILAIVENVRTTPLPATELDKAKTLMTRALPQDFETNGSIVGAYRDVVITGRPLTWFASYADNVRKVTAEDTKASAADDWKSLAIVVVGDWKVLGPGLAGLGLPIEHADAEGRPTRR